MTGAVQLFEQGNEGPFAAADTEALLARNDRLDAYFWLEHGQKVLELGHVRHGAEGFFVRWKHYRAGVLVEAIGRCHPHGLALAPDGGGNPLVIDSACVLDRETTAAVVREFAATGGRSEAVAWGRGIVRSEGGGEDGWQVEETGSARGPRGWLPGGLRATLAGAPERKLVETATWRVIEEIELRDARWLAVMVERPMHCLRELTIEDPRGSFEAVARAVAGSPALERLVVLGAALTTLTPISSPRLRWLQVVLADADAEQRLPPDWRERLKATLARGELPALQVLAIDEDVEDDEYDDDEGDD